MLCVDDFGIKTYSTDDLHHLLDALKEMYEITTDPTGSNYIGLTIQWEYEKGYVDISMPHYIEKLLQKFHHTPPNRRLQGTRDGEWSITPQNHPSRIGAIDERYDHQAQG